MWKDTIKPIIFQLSRLLSQKNFSEYLENSGIDRYVKKLFTTQLLIILVYAHLKKHEGLRAISDSLKAEGYKQAIELDGISASQLSRRLNKLPTEVLQVLSRDLVTHYQLKIGASNVRKALGRIYLIDSSTISLCLSRYNWAVFRKSKGGIKLHLRLEFYEDGVLPDCAIITEAKLSDKTQMAALVWRDSNAINVFDRGYIDYKKFDAYCENGVRFVSRLKKNAAVETVKECSVKSSGHITSDRVVYLGKEGTTKMKHPIRLIETVDTEGNPFIIVTNDFELTADEISTIYRNRWQIELFFKWMKQNLTVKHFYGLSRQAVTNQILIALITYCLLMLLKLETGFKGSLTTLKRLLITCSFETFEAFVKKLLHKPKRRRKLDPEADLELIERMVIADADCIYSQYSDDLYV